MNEKYLSTYETLQMIRGLALRSTNGQSFSTSPQAHLLKIAEELKEDADFTDLADRLSKIILCANAEVEGKQGKEREVALNGILNAKLSQLCDGPFRELVLAKKDVDMPAVITFIDEKLLDNISFKKEEASVITRTYKNMDVSIQQCQKHIEEARKCFLMQDYDAGVTNIEQLSGETSKIKGYATLLRDSFRAEGEKVDIGKIDLMISKIVDFNEEVKQLHDLVHNPAFKKALKATSKESSRQEESVLTRLKSIETKLKTMDSSLQANKASGFLERIGWHKPGEKKRQVEAALQIIQEEKARVTVEDQSSHKTRP